MRRRKLAQIDVALDREMSEFCPTHVLVVKGTFIRASTLDRLRNEHADIQICCFHPDDPLSRVRGSSSDQMRECISLYDHYFTWSRRLVRAISEYGGRNVHYLPFAVDPRLFFPPPQPRRFRYDVCFVGNPDAERIDWISRIRAVLPDRFSMVCYGASWPEIRGVVTFPVVFGKELLNAIYESRISVNILRTQNKGASNMRTFELPATQSFVLHEYSDEVREMFAEGKEIEFFRSADEFSEKASYYLQHQADRERIARAGRASIQSNRHTYDDRVSSILGVMSNG